MTSPTGIDTSGGIRAPRGTTLTCRSWLSEAVFRMLQNNRAPEVAKSPAELVVYGGIGRAARNWECFDKIVETLKNLETDETLLVQSGKPVGVFKTHQDAPRVLIANSNLVPHWANWKHFNEMDAKGLAMYGQMTAGSWIYTVSYTHLDVYKRQVTEGEHVVTAILASAQECKWLKINKTEPCLLIRRRTWSNKQLISSARLIYPGSRYYLEGKFTQ